MDGFLINGPTRLSGEVNISGAKNAALPIMTACLGYPGIYRLKNVPDLRDTRTMIKLLEIIGSKVSKDKNNITIDSRNCNNPEAPYQLVKTMRASFYVLGPLLSRFKYSKVSLPGGCAWGPRPVNYHIKAFEDMGAKVTLDSGYILAEGNLVSSKVVFEKSSVGATGNALMACMNLNEIVIIENAAIEPDIVDLCNFLVEIGMKIEGIGTKRLEVLGIPQNKNIDISYTIIPDRIEAGTFLLGAAMTNGDVTLKNVNPNHLSIVMDKLKQCGCRLTIKSESVINIQGPEKIMPVDIVADIYPGYPTDLQAQWIALMSLANGDSHVTDTVYLDRFSHVPELNRLGAIINNDNNIANIVGVDKLYGAEVMSTDIRASASLILAAIAAYGQTKISRIYHIDRGYELIELKLSLLGSDIKRIKID